MDRDVCRINSLRLRVSKLVSCEQQLAALGGCTSSTGVAAQYQPCSNVGNVGGQTSARSDST